MPLVFGLGGPLAAMVGTSIGAGKRERALRVTWTGAIIAGLLTEAIGLGGAFFPQAWLGLFSQDATSNAVGAQYLRIVGPFYGFFGVGLVLYFASQGAGRLAWPLIGATLRVTIAVAGGWLALRYWGDITGVFFALGIALMAFSIINSVAIASGVWFSGAPQAAKRNAAILSPPIVKS